MRPVMKEHKNHICVIVMMAYTAIPFRGVLHSIPACHQDQLHCALVPATLDRAVKWYKQNSCRPQSMKMKKENKTS